MQRLKRSSWFWTLLLVVVALPVGLSATKMLYQAGIKDAAGNGKGSSVIMVRPAGYDYIARTYALPGQVVTEVWLTDRDNTWQIPLCTNGGPTVDDCTYADDGNLDIEGAITPTMLMLAGVTGRAFNETLRAGNLGIALSDGSGGFYIRIM